MNPGELPLQQLCDAAIGASQAAGRFVRGADRSALQRQFKDSGSSAASQLVTEVDVRSEAIIRAALQSSCAEWDIAFVGEESSPDAAAGTPERLLKPWFWCVDPLDGTLPFVQGSPGYAVSIALVERSGTPLVGVVYDPVGAVTLHAVKGQGAYRNLRLIERGSTDPTPLTVFADASFRTQENYAAVVEILNDCARDTGLEGLSIVYGSGAVKNACQVLDYAAACYVKPPKAKQGGGSIWDYAATACIVGEAGGWSSNIRGEPLELNRRDSTFMNHQGVVYASSERIGRYLVNAFDSGA